MITAAYCLAIAMWGEARGEQELGQKMVAQVVLNRVQSKGYPSNVCSVVFQPKQFQGAEDAAQRSKTIGWMKLVPLAERILAGTEKMPTTTATNFYATWGKTPYWAKHMTFIGQVGHHLFYRRL